MNIGRIRALRMIGAFAIMTLSGGLVGISHSQQIEPFSMEIPGLTPEQGRIGGLVPGTGTTYLGPITPNAYGAGINADATGRPFQWQPDGMPRQSGPDPTLQVTPNAYGLGVHADQYGRVVRPTCPFGQSAC